MRTQGKYVKVKSYYSSLRRGIESNIEEVNSSLRRKLAKNLITKEYFDTKYIKTPYLSDAILRKTQKRK